MADDGKPVILVHGALANYALRYVGIPDDFTALSADYFGVFGTLLQRPRAESFVATLSNGASGDISNVDVMGRATNRNDHYQHCERAAAIVGANALWPWDGAESIGEAPVAGVLAEVTLDPRPPATAEELAMAQDIEDRLAADEPVLMGGRSFQRRVRRFEAESPRAHATVVQALRIGDLALVGTRGEPFVEPGLEVKRRSRLAQTMVLELASDSVGYTPTRRASEEGAYEPSSSPYLPGFGEPIVETAVGLLEELES
ncbi:hypothetical protein LLH23_01705 [bacterium]|nr:hypothetical protein [bacterium]